MKSKHIYWIIFIWIFIVGGSFYWNSKMISSNNWNVVLNKSRAFFSQIKVTRSWNSMHGGVYVPITSKTKPNEYLKDSLRDIKTIEGLELTKVNPAYMTRQLAEINKEYYEFQSHITSLNPIRPENAADEWEIRMLNLFEKGVSEQLELVKKDSVWMYRYMAPLETEKSCLACHAAQGYKEGDIRGGISVSFPAGLYVDLATKEKAVSGSAHLIIFFLGVVVLLFWYRIKISQQKNRDIRDRNLELVKANVRKDKFLSIISHDLRTPFNGIIGISELALEMIKDHDYEKVNQFLDHIVVSSKRGYDLLNNMLQWTRLQTQQVVFKPRRFLFKKMEFELRALFLSNMKLKNITCTTDVPEEIEVFADEDMLQTVMRNIVSNAIKFSNEGGNIHVSAYSDGKSTTINIKDEGVGMSEEIKNNIFDANQITTQKGTESEPGSGLGMVLCYELIKMHNGDIIIDSIEGEGTLVSIILPLFP